MKHRHSGTYRSRTPKGRVVYKKRPLHSQMNKYKNLNYNQLRRRFKIHPLRDDDGDGKRNYEDCRPWDKKRQDLRLGKLDKGTIAYVEDDSPDIFISDWKLAEPEETPDIIEHEQLHRTLLDEVGPEASRGLDEEESKEEIQDRILAETERREITDLEKEKKHLFERYDFSEDDDELQKISLELGAIQDEIDKRTEIVDELYEKWNIN